MMSYSRPDDVAPQSDIEGFAFAAILWDMDGTLADSEPVHQRSFLDACDALGITLPDGFHDGLIGQSETAIYQILVETVGLDESLPVWSERRFAAYLARIAEVRPFGITQDIWRAVAALGVPQAIVSNAPRLILRANVAQLGFDPDEVLTISLDDVSKGKPDPEPYLRAAERLSVAPQDVAVVEDSLSGLVSASAAGMSAFMMPGFQALDAPKWQPVEILHRAVRNALSE